MKKLIFIFSFLVVISAAVLFLSSGNQNDLKANTSELSALPDWPVTVLYEYGNNGVYNATVHIKLNGTGSELFGGPHPTNSSGVCYFNNGGNHFPDGSYEVRAVYSGFGDGVTTQVISGGVPVYPTTTVRLGPAE